MAPKAHSPPRFAAALVLLAATMTVVQLEIVAAQDDPCVPFDLVCKEDEICRACQEVVGTNVTVFEDCQLNYGFSDDICINQSAQSCCQDASSPNDCLTSAAYTDFYECRLSLDVPGGDCTVLNCNAVGGALTAGDETTTVDITADATDTAEPDAPVKEEDGVEAEDDGEDADADVSTTVNSAGRVTTKAGFLMMVGVVAAAFV